ncbi:hypothetical protein HDU97_002991 [Phlyctochytrium planicorne]|nr:hypothetical protein HDU97_002991 [Phlyctochytrium planicorne]
MFVIYTPPTIQFKGAATVAKSGAIIDDLGIRQVIANLITKNIFPSDANALYVFVGGFETLMNQITVQGQGYCTVFCGYHSNFKSTATLQKNLKYVVGGMTCKYCGSADMWEALQMTISHEIIEAITNPLVSEATDLLSPLAWYNTVAGEIMDICNAVSAKSKSRKTGISWTVQKFWSNAKLQCVDPAS